MNITFKPLAESYFSLLLKWLNTPHVKSWWDQNIIWSADLIRQKYTTYVKGYKLENERFKEISAFIILADTKPIGYIQIYNAYDFPRGNKLTELPENLATFDMYIGEIDYLSKSIGSSSLKLFLNTHCNSKYSHIFADPEADNIAAINCYTKAGFEIVKTNYTTNEIWMLKKNEKC